MSDGPDILLIVWDTARADALEPYGAPIGATPVLADLGRRGVVVEGVHATASWTLPSHVSMFAGAMPRALGMGDVVGLTPAESRIRVEALRDRLLPCVLGRAGYTSAAVSTNPWVSTASGFATGFDSFADVLPHNRAAQLAAPTRRGRLAWRARAVAAHADDGADAAAGLLETAFAARTAAPAFWFANLVECHSPYLPPRPFAELGPRGRARAAAEASAWLTLEGIWRACIMRAPPPPDALDRMRAGYRGAIRYMDAWLGRVLDALPRPDDTLVIVTSDHGENFGEGGLIGHAFSLDERLTRVPLVAAGPGAESLAGLGSLGELPARLAELAGASAPYSADDLPPLPAAQFDTPIPPLDDPRSQAAAGDWRLTPAAAARMVQPHTAAIDGTAKLVVEGGQERFFDLARDPLEADPGGPERLDAAAVARLRATIDHPAMARPASRPDAGAAPDADADEVAELEARMRHLGYL